MILGLLALCIVIIRGFPETTTAQWLNKVLVEQPLEWLSKLKRRDIILLFTTVVLLFTAGEFIAVFGAAEMLALAANLSLYVDAVMVTTAATIAAAIATAWRGVRTRLSIWWRRGATRQIRARKTRRPKSVDDEDAPGWAPSHAF
ncbi:MAG: hypothetical protein ABL889_22520 [Terricaulis sp.]